LRSAASGEACRVVRGPVFGGGRGRAEPGGIRVKAMEGVESLVAAPRNSPAYGGWNVQKVMTGTGESLPAADARDAARGGHGRRDCQSPVGWDPAGRGGVPVAGQCLPAPAGPGLVDTRARGAGPLCRRPGGDVCLPAAGRGRARAAAGPAGRTRTRTEGGQDRRSCTWRREARGSTSSASTTGWCARRAAPGNARSSSSPAGPRPAAVQPPATVSVSSRSGPGCCAGRTHRAGDEPLPARLGRVLPSRELGPGVREGERPRGGTAVPVRGQAPQTAPPVWTCPVPAIR